MTLDPKKMRELVLLFLFSLDTGTPPSDDLVAMVRKECKVSRKYACEAFEQAQKIMQEKDALDKLLSELSSEYRIERLGSVERSVARLALFELQEGLTPKIAISEAKRLTKKFATEQATTFVHGLLSAACDRLDIKEENLLP